MRLRNLIFIVSLSIHLPGAIAMPVGEDHALIPRQRRVSATGGGSKTAKDGSTIIENQVRVNGLNMRFKVSAPASALVSSGGGDQQDTALGINVLLHGDGGQSFFDFPNQGVNNNLMGVALLSPDPQRRWGGSGNNNNPRPQGAAHSAAINKFLTDELPKIVAFDKNKIFMEGISGGSLLLSGFMVPSFGASLGIQGVVMGCGGLTPQVNVQGDITKIRIHWQSTANEQANLRGPIPAAIKAYEKLLSDSGLSDDQINEVQTADASPNGGHCAFDGRGFVSGVQRLTDNFSNILSGNGRLDGVNVNKGITTIGNLFNDRGNANNNAGARNGNGQNGRKTGAGAGGRGRGRGQRARNGRRANVSNARGAHVNAAEGSEAGSVGKAKASGGETQVRVDVTGRLVRETLQERRRWSSAQ